MTIRSYKTHFSQELSALYDEKEIESFFFIVLQQFHNMRRIDLALNPDAEMDAMQLLRWESVLLALKKFKPIQYILGETTFYGLSFLVNENTLIPRPETEELVELIISDIKNSQTVTRQLKILDIGTGSGCIAISLAKAFPEAQIVALDVSEKALAVAQKNAKLNNVHVNFVHVDILKCKDLTQLATAFDIIVSNPPYVRNLEKTEINSNVIDYEPHLALFVADDNPLLFYKKIAQLAQEGLSAHGKLYFEINQYLGKETSALLESLDFKNIALEKDIYNNDRMIYCTK